MALVSPPNLPLPHFSEVGAAQFTCGTSAAALTSTALGDVGFAVLQADPANAGTVLLGGSGGQYVTLSAGTFFPCIIPLTNLSLIYGKGSQAAQLLNAFIVK